MTSERVILTVVLILGLLAVGGLGAMFTLAYQDKGVPDALISITSLAGGGVAGLLAKTSSGPPEPPPT